MRDLYVQLFGLYILMKVIMTFIVVCVTNVIEFSLIGMHCCSLNLLCELIIIQGKFEIKWLLNISGGLAIC